MMLGVAVVAAWAFLISVFVCIVHDLSKLKRGRQLL